MKHKNLSKWNIWQSLFENTSIRNRHIFVEIDIFQFPTNFTKITLVSHRVQRLFRKLRKFAISEIQKSLSYVSEKLVAI